MVATRIQPSVLVLKSCNFVRVAASSFSNSCNRDIDRPKRGRHAQAQLQGFLDGFLQRFLGVRFGGALLDSSDELSRFR